MRRLSLLEIAHGVGGANLSVLGRGASSLCRPAPPRKAGCRITALALCAAAACGDPAPPAHDTYTTAPPAPDAVTTDAGPGASEGGSTTSHGEGAEAGSAAGSPTSTTLDGATGVPSEPPDAGSGNDARAVDGDAGGAPTPAQGACTPNAYVSNSFSDSVSVIDTRTHEVVATIPTGTAPVNPTFTPDRKHVYVSNSQADTLTVIDVETNEATSIPAGGMSPSGLAFSPDGGTLYVSFIGDLFVAPGEVRSIDLNTGEASAPIPMGADPERIALTPDGGRLYVNNLLDGTMAVVDTSTSKVITTLMLGDLPFNPLMSPDGSVVYVGVMSENQIAVVDTKTNQISKTIAADSPNGMTFSNDFQSLFVSNALSGTVQEVSLAMDGVVKTEDVGGVPGNIAVLPDGEHAYMVRPDGDTVEVLDLASLMIVETITVESGPSVVAICRPPTALVP